MAADNRWNWNIHYHSVVLNAVPSDATSALDVGTGDGLLAFDLADRELRVVAVDTDGDSVVRARADTRASSGQIEFVVGDLFTYEFVPSSFDVVASIAMLHHVDAEAGLRRMKELVRPGGVVAIVGFAGVSRPTDRARALSGALYKRWRQLRRRYWEHHAPTMWPPPLSMDEMAALADRVLPGAAFNRLLSGRYSIVWRATCD